MSTELLAIKARLSRQRRLKKKQSPAVGAGDWKTHCKRGNPQQGILAMWLWSSCNSKLSQICLPVGEKRNDSKLYPLQEWQDCSDGLSCTTGKSINGAKKHTCLPALTQGKVCESKIHNILCAIGYKCITVNAYSEDVPRCNAKRYISISGENGSCGEENEQSAVLVYSV